MIENKETSVKTVRLEFLREAGLGLANPNVKVANHIAGENLANFTATVPSDSEMGKQLRDAYEELRSRGNEELKKAEENLQHRHLETFDLIDIGIPDIENKIIRRYHDLCWEVSLRFDLI